MSAYPPQLLCDFYKLSHREQYPPGTESIYSTWIPRESRVPGVRHVVAFGFQAFCKQYLIDYFNEHFFERDVIEVVDEYNRLVSHTLLGGARPPVPEHLIALHQLGYLPIHIRALPEGTLVPLRVPMLTIENTDPRFYWLTNFLETLMSCQIWMPCTSATIAWEYRKMLSKYAIESVGNDDFVPFQGHDFAMRGMSGVDAAAASGAAHLLSFVGTDTIPAILFAERYYRANIERQLVGTSIPATEHSVMSSRGRDEVATFTDLLTRVYPSGFVSVVSDTWDFWKVLTETLPQIKDVIMARDGRLVVRPDSGDPVKIICGDIDAAPGSPAFKGAVEILWEIFGGEESDEGYKVLDSHVGLIYGDAITWERARDISVKLMENGFASINVVYGIGSFTYQYQTRDTFGFAMKSTHMVRNGEESSIFKDPATDIGKMKKSLVGRVIVRQDNETLVAVDHLTIEQESKQRENLLNTIFLDGKLTLEYDFESVRARLLSNLYKEVGV